MSKACPVLSWEEKPGGGGLLGTENPGGAEICTFETAKSHDKRRSVDVFYKDKTTLEAPI